MSVKVAELQRLLSPDNLAGQIAEMWSRYNDQRQGQIDLWQEQRNYVFATDTTTTTQSGLPWKNTTTLPKLCQIRDNLHSNYLSALFPNDDWMKWEAYDADGATKAKAVAIQGYMSNKVREGGTRNIVSKLLLDYIDYGNAFGFSSFENNTAVTEDGDVIPQFIGPKAGRISPLDIVFNPLAPSFDETWKIVRSIKTIGELKVMAEAEPDNSYLQEALEKREFLKSSNRTGVYSTEDWSKAQAYSVDGWGNLKEYYESDYVELLEFWGDIHDPQSGKLHKNSVITVIDRSCVIRDVEMPTWMKTAPIRCAGWRKRPDNLWAMGPLENLVGMQYRIDHLENSRADALDLSINPPLVVVGEVEQFNYGPNTEIHVDEGGSVTELGKNLGSVIQADNEIVALEQRMEMFAGAPREAMGIRTAGEKTAFEVQQLQNAAGRIFQEKIDSFEIELLEPLLNDMLETARRNVMAGDIVRIMNDDLGVNEFLKVTKEDITANGKIRPIGARHFAAQAQLVTNLNLLFNSNLGEVIKPHVSSKRLSKLMEESLGLQRHQLFEDNIAVSEAKETAQLVNQAQDDNALEAPVGVPNEDQLG